jgi:hypothetical protein
VSAAKVVLGRLLNATSASNRVNALLAPEGTPNPRVTFQQISATKLHAMGQDGSVTRVRVQVNCWGDTYGQAVTLAAEVEARLSRYRGVAAGVTVLDVLLDNELETYEMDSATRRVIQDYTLFLRG